MFTEVRRYFFRERIALLDHAVCAVGNGPLKLSLPCLRAEWGVAGRKAQTWVNRKFPKGKPSRI